MLGGDRERAPVGHGVHGVQDQVGQDLGERAGRPCGDSAACRSRRSSSGELSWAIFSSQRGRVIATASWTTWLMSTLTNCSSGRRRANVLDAPDRLGAVHGRRLDHPERALDQLAVRQVLLHELGVAEDRLQQVVEVVGDAAGQPAQRGELLRLVQLVFDLPLRR